MENINKIYRHLHEINDSTLFDKLLINIVDDKIIQYEIFSSKITDINQTNIILHNYKIKYGIDKDEILLKEQLPKTINALKASISKLQIQDQEIINKIKPRINAFIELIQFLEVILEEKSFSSHVYITQSKIEFFTLNKVILSIMNYYARNEKTVGFLLLSLYYAEYKKSFSTGLPFESNIFEESKKVDLLYFLDFNPVYLKEWFLTSYLIPILKYRLLNVMPVIILSEYSFLELKQELNKQKLSIKSINELINLLRAFDNKLF